MKASDAILVLAEVTSHQWGLLTSAQAAMQGITRLDLSRLTGAGHLRRLAHGVYKDSGAPDDEFDDLRAAWLSTDPTVLGEARLRDRVGGVVVSGASAARLHDIGDLWADVHDFVAPMRRQSQRAVIRYRRRCLAAGDVTLVQGLPAMTVERTIADLVEDVGDLGLVAAALRDAARQRNLDLDRLRELLAPLAGRNGLRRGDGNALLDRLLGIAGMDVDAVARRVAADPSLGPRVAAEYLGGLADFDVDRLMMAPGMQEWMRGRECSLAEAVAGSLTAQIAAVDASPEAAVATVGARAAVATKGIARLVAREAIMCLSREWKKPLSADIALTSETLATMVAVQKVPAGGRT